MADFIKVCLVDENGSPTGSTAFKDYAANFSQAGIDDPDVQVYNDNLPAGIVWTRVGVGRYLGTADSIFFTAYVGLSAIDGYSVAFKCVDVSNIEMTVLDADGNPVDGITDLPISIRFFAGMAP